MLEQYRWKHNITVICSVLSFALNLGNNCTPWGDLTITHIWIVKTVLGYHVALLVSIYGYLSTIHMYTATL